MRYRPCHFGREDGKEIVPDMAALEDEGLCGVYKNILYIWVHLREA